MKYAIKWVLFLSFYTLFLLLLCPIFLFQWHDKGWSKIEDGLIELFGVSKI